MTVGKETVNTLFLTPKKVRLVVEFIKIIEFITLSMAQTTKLLHTHTHAHRHSTSCLLLLLFLDYVNEKLLCSASALEIQQQIFLFPRSLSLSPSSLERQKSM